MDPAHRSGARMIELRIPSASARGVAAICQVRAGGVQTGAGTLAYKVDHHIRVDELTDVVSRTHASVVNHDDHLSDPLTGLREKTPDRGQHRAKLFVDCLGVQAVRDDYLNASAAARGRPQRTGILFSQPLAGRGMSDEI